jgi:alkylhydroperoxidase family enzyme
MFAHHPELAMAFLTFNRHLVTSTLEPRHREILILRVARRCNSDFEWGQHARIGLSLGMSSDELARIVEGPHRAEWSALERHLLLAADELLDNAAMSDGTWRYLSAEFDKSQLLDVVFTVGAYMTIAMALRSFEVELDDDLRPFVLIGRSETPS